jgi:hypothetical protein
MLFPSLGFLSTPSPSLSSSILLKLIPKLRSMFVQDSFKIFMKLGSLDWVDFSTSPHKKRFKARVWSLVKLEVGAWTSACYGFFMIKEAILNLGLILVSTSSLMS